MLWKGLKMHKKGTFFFRCDGNSHIGSGHIMRCLALADNAADQGYECCFLTAGNEFEKIIHNHKHKRIVLNTDYGRLDNDLNYTINLVKIHKPKALFVDSYLVNDFYLHFLHCACALIQTMLIYIDDILSFPYSCDLLLNYNIYAQDKEDEYRVLYKKKNMLEIPDLLLGTSYAPLRKEFQGLPERIVKKVATNILVSTGGADFLHLGLALVHEVINNNEMLATLHFDIIVGLLNEDVKEIISLTAKIPNISIHRNITQMSILMQKSDVAISAAGSTLYELCATQTPTITFILADNQILGAESFEKYGVLKNSGDVREKGNEEAAKELIKNATELSQDYKERKRIAGIQRTIIDGMGAQRIIAKLH